MASLRCCTLTVPILAVLAPFFASFAVEGWVVDLIPGWRPSEIPDLTGKVAIVTGPTLKGLGYETSLELARKGAHVIMVGRSRTKGEKAVRELKKVLPDARAEFAELDLASLASVESFAKAFLRRQLPLHILVNNAGIMASFFMLTQDGLESQFATNHLGHFLLTRLLLPVLETSAPARIVTLSSAAAYFPGVFSQLAKILPPALLPGAPPQSLSTQSTCVRTPSRSTIPGWRTGGRSLRTCSSRGPWLGGSRARRSTPTHATPAASALTC